MNVDFCEEKKKKLSQQRDQTRSTRSALHQSITAGRMWISKAFIHLTLILTLTTKKTLTVNPTRGASPHWYSVRAHTVHKSIILARVYIYIAGNEDGGMG